MAVNLTTRYLFKLSAGITGTGDDDLIDYLITWVSEAIAHRCGGRTFEDTTYKTWVDGTGTNALTLPNWPINNVYAVSMSTKDVGEITFTGGTFATVELRDGNMELMSVDTAGAETNTEIALATYPIMSDLATQVATVSGWTRIMAIHST